VKVLLTGAAGQLGGAIARAFAGHEVVAHTRATLDITSADAVRRAVADAAPAVVINCAAYNAVDAAEDRPADAFAVNAMAVRSLARAAEAAGATFVHYGTDFVFDGEASEPYREETAPAPRSVYAMSKLVGEWFALEHPRGFVLRVESLFGTPRGWSGRRSTVESIVAGLQQNQVVRVFTDRIVSPSYVGDVAAATRHLVEGSVEGSVETGTAPGLYHCVNTGHASWHDVAVDIARLLGVTPRLEPMTTTEAALKARRPRFCALDNGKLAAAGFRMPEWQDAVRRWIAMGARLSA
jgi:dTDP-4-dehydrorhamnose reductase